ncbi:hypothetical protein ROLI_018850 [Roseobacter fucihabitans]|uniref:HTH araC/xylS-type domain-containing protein n=1 Tax=Roseobacter fucihabitans TaxID=1537242 RepID=A0ABZ2BTR6_9RHOB|nr:helix-turn-helix transcriptional regulator [Roseobacter litoralis]MBC6968138.1 transcriptional activator FtrA [Roseobacter litoralis]
MISIPLPLFLTLCAALMGLLILTRPWLMRGAKTFFVALVGVIMVETILVALRFAYQIEGVLVLQRLLPFWIGPLLYLGFVTLSDHSDVLARTVLKHLGVALALSTITAAIPQTRIALDLMIGLSYAAYAILLMRLWRGGPDRLSHLAVAHVPKMRRLMLLGIMLLAITCVMDAVIAVDFARNQGENVSRLLSFGSLALITLFAGAVFWVAKTPAHSAHPGAPQTDDSAAILRQAEEFLTQSQLFTDPDLSLTRLARRLGVTDRALSSAVNRQTGTNVSQFINGFRVRQAAQLLRDTKDPVGIIGEASGFLTRSNFYTEFQRVYGQSPGAYRKG